MAWVTLRSATDDLRRSQQEDEAFHRKVTLLCGLAADRLDDLLSALGVRTYKTGKVRVGCCPVHGGNRANALNLYPDGHTARGIWFCKTRECEKVFKKNLLGLVQGVMSRERFGWARKGDRTVPFDEARDWLCQFVGQKWRDLRPDLAQASRAKFVRSMGVFEPPPVRKAVVTPHQVARRLTIPSPYFLGRGFGPAVLEAFLVGEPTDAGPDSPMFERAVAPVLCPAGRSVLGYSGRSIHEKCAACGAHHRQGSCPPEEYQASARYAKWRHHSFNAREVLYGLHLARPAVEATREVILTEGPGKVWRLHEAGYQQAVAIFGVSLDDPQQAALECLPAERVTLLLDPGEAGRKGAADIVGRLGRLFRVRDLEPPEDPADMSPSDLKSFLEANPW